jgi:hypothetical protein
VAADENEAACSKLYIAGRGARVEPSCFSPCWGTRCISAVSYNICPCSRSKTSGPCWWLQCCSETQWPGTVMAKDDVAVVVVVVGGGGGGVAAAVVF